MIKKISKGIQVSVEVFYQNDFSNPLQNEFMFAYRINIENQNNFPVQLLNRHWKIFDSIGEKKDIEGEGVIGEQPTIQPGESFKYLSGCNLKSEMGKMHGTYTLQNLYNQSIFTVIIPVFELVYPYKYN